MKKYILESNFRLINDIKRIILMYDDGNQNRHSFIHPIHAEMLSFFDGTKPLDVTYQQISSYFNISIEAVERIVNPLIDNDREIRMKYDNEIFTFPNHLLVEAKPGEVRTDLNRENYVVEAPFDFKTVRFNKPYSIYFVINTNCKTECVYCYANKKHQYTPLSHEKIISIFEEAKDIGIKDVSISGGEIFLQPRWDELLKYLVDNGYDPYISTKIPLTDEQIKKLVATGIRKMQVSIDTFDKTLITNDLLVMPEYIDKMKDSLRSIDNAGIRLILKGTQTRETATVENIRQVVDFALTLKHVERYTVSTIGYVRFKGLALFKKIRPTLEQISNLQRFIDETSPHLPFGFFFDNQAVFTCEMQNKEEFKKRSFCSGNTTGFVLLPDGKATICEELYWNPHFILGDLNKQSILEMWQSEKAFNIWNTQPSDFPKSSACSQCDIFHKCRHGAGVCWKMIVAAYGEDNYNYPDPRCPEAPELITNFCYD